MVKYIVKRLDNGRTVLKTFSAENASKFQARYGSPTKVITVPVSR